MNVSLLILLLHLQALARRASRLKFSSPRCLADSDFISDSSRVRTNGGPIRTRGGRRGGRVVGGRFRKESKTAEDLDKELDSFMADDSSKPAQSVSAPVPAAAPAPTGDADVEMET